MGTAGSHSSPSYLLANRPFILNEMGEREMTNRSILLRQWRDEDIESFAEMNAGPEVMRFLRKALTRAESEEFMARLWAYIDERGWGFAVPTFSIEKRANDWREHRVDAPIL